MSKYIGCSGYHYNDWKGKFYPEDLHKDKWLEYYAKHFSSVEINNTFYKIPDASTLKEWIDITPDYFNFSVKGSRYITHMKKLKDVEKHLNRFYEAIEPLKEKTKVILWQLPGNLHKNENKIEEFCKLLRKDYKNVIEFRHLSWFSDEIFNILSANDVITCSLSAPGDLPEDLYPQKDTIYLRFHGKKEWYKDNYSNDELMNWSKRIKNSGAEEVYVYFNNDHNAYSTMNAEKLNELL